MPPNANNLISDILHLMGGTFSGGIPSIAVMALPFVVGLIIGYILRKALKIGIILLVIAFVLSYFEIVSFSAIADQAKKLIVTYGPQAQSYIAVFLGFVPLSIGLVIGIILGFVL